MTLICSPVFLHCCGTKALERDGGDGISVLVSHTWVEGNQNCENVNKLAFLSTRHLSSSWGHHPLPMPDLDAIIKKKKSIANPTTSGNPGFEKTSPRNLET